MASMQTVVLPNGSRFAATVQANDRLDPELQALLAPHAGSELRVQKTWQPPDRAPGLLVLHVAAEGRAPDLKLLAPVVPATARKAFLEQSPPAHTLLLVPLASGRELVLTVVRPPGSSSKKPGSSAGGGGGYPVLLGYLLRAGAAALAAELVESGRLVVELDLDDTLVKACTVSSLRADLAQRQREAEELAQVLAHMEAQQGAAAEAAEVAAQLAQARREMELRQADLQLLTDYMDTDCVTVDGQRQEAALEQEVSEAGELVERPVVRLDGGRKILTRPEAGNRYTSMMIHIRPGWDLLRAALLGDDAPPHADGTRKQRFRIAVCTTAQRGYALEAVRLLGLTPELIAPGQRQSRVVNVPSISGMPTKSLARVLAPVAAEQPEAVAALGSAVPLAVIVDDQPKVWDEASRGQVLQVAAWGYYREAALKQVAQGQAAGNKVPASENELVRVRDALMQLRSALFLSIMEVLRPKVVELHKDNSPLMAPAAALKPGPALLPPVHLVPAQLLDPLRSDFLKVPVDGLALEPSRLVRLAPMAASTAALPLQAPALAASSAGQAPAADAHAPVDPRVKLTTRANASQAADEQKALQSAIHAAAASKQLPTDPRKRPAPATEAPPAAAPAGQQQLSRAVLDAWQLPALVHASAGLAGPPAAGPSAAAPAAWIPPGSLQPVNTFATQQQLGSLQPASAVAAQPHAPLLLPAQAHLTPGMQQAYPPPPSAKRQKLDTAHNGVGGRQLGALDNPHALLGGAQPYAAAPPVVSPLLAAMLQSGEKNPVSMILELEQKAQVGLEVGDCKKSGGVGAGWTCQVRLQGEVIGHATSSTKKTAKHDAAQKALKHLEAHGLPSPAAAPAEKATASQAGNAGGTECTPIAILNQHYKTPGVPAPAQFMGHSQSGTKHEPVFTTTLVLHNPPSGLPALEMLGQGRSKRAAKHNAARRALESLVAQGVLRREQIAHMTPPQDLELGTDDNKLY